MSTGFAITEEQLSDTDARACVPIERIAFYIQSQGAPLFAWLHYAADKICFDHGAIICPPIGYEQLHSHRALRHLADSVAGEGIPVLRFDYHGTGDSAGSDDDPNRVVTWLTNIDDCMDWMRDQFGFGAISLLGLRMGATLATLTAAKREVDNLVLWAPILKGRAYVREMKALSLTADAELQRSRNSGDAIEAAGFVLTAAAADELSRLALLEAKPQCRHALIVSRADVPEDVRLQNHLTSLGIETSQSPQDGFALMMAEPHFTEVPQAAIQHIAKWLSKRIGAEGSRDRILHLPDDMPTTADLSHGQRSLLESTCEISTHPNLFGILSEPGHRVDPDLPLVVLLNAGCAYRIGPGRLNVELGRHLTTLGFRTLRMDLGGLGDSIVSDFNRENNPYAASAFRDIDLTLAYAQQNWNAQRIVLTGLCSGAYSAFQSAVQLSNPVLIESVLINPLTFFWKVGMSLETADTTGLIAWHYYLNAICTPRKWMRLIAGKSHLGIAGALKRLLRYRRNNSNATLKTLPSCKSELSAEYSHPARDDLSADLSRAVMRGRNLSLFCSASDAGHFILMRKAGRKARKLEREGKLKSSFISGADHTFSTSAARGALIEKISQHLLTHYRQNREML